MEFSLETISLGKGALAMALTVVRDQPFSYKLSNDLEYKGALGGSESSL